MSRFLSAALLIALLPATLQAAEADAAKPAAPATLLEELTSGGALHVGALVALLLCSIFEVAVILERTVNLRRGRLVPPAFAAELAELARRNEADPETWRGLCRRHPSPAAEIVGAGLVRIGRPPPEIEKAMEDAAAREAGELRAWVRPLAVLGNLGPLVGLLGTVFGMIMAFRTAAQGGLGKAELMAHGISIALITTVAGLVIAIPGYAAAAWFNAKIERALRRIDGLVMPLLPQFSKLQERARPGSLADVLAAAGPVRREDARSAAEATPAAAG